MRASTLLNRVLNLEGATVTGVHPGSVVGDGPVVVRLRLRRRVMLCPSCSYRTRHRYDSRPVDSRWRHLDLCGRLCELTMQRRRLRCPEHGVVTEAVDFARPGSRFTRDFEDLVVWLVTKADKTTVATFARYAEVMGATTLQVDLREPATVADLIHALRSLPGGALLPAQPLVAVNLQQAVDSTAIAPSDQLALLPPLAGG